MISYQSLGYHCTNDKLVFDLGYYSPIAHLCVWHFSLSVECSQRTFLSCLRRDDDLRFSCNMPSAAHARLRERRKESTNPMPSFSHTSRRRSHLTFLELSERNERQPISTADKVLAAGQVHCALDPAADRGDLKELCEPCETLAAAVIATCGVTTSVESSLVKPEDAWTRASGSDTLILTDHHGDYQALVHSGRTCRLCYLLSTSWYGARSRQVRASLKYRIQRGKLDDGFSLWTQKIDVCSNGCCTHVQTEFQKLRTFEPFLKWEDTEVASILDADALTTENKKGSVSGREVKADSASGHCTNLIKQWLRICRLKHPDCSRNQTSLLPKRVIDVRPPFGGEDCRLVEPLYREYAPYIALSHCWGGRSLFCTTRENVESHKECLRLEDFPKTFRDAVLLTRALGFQYLWIDALCILQGDARDWEEQAEAVGDYYRNAVLTISAMRAPNYNAGLFHSRKSVAAELQSNLASGNSKQLFVREAYFPSPSNTAKITGPVSERAWVLQERLLSPAVLHFTKREIIWECRTQTLFEHGSYVKPQDYETKLLLTTGERNRNNRSTPGWKMSRKDRFKEWYRLVQTYSTKKLTRSDDRLPAIAGLASRFHAMCRSNYLAGIWEDDALRGLLWNTDDQAPPADGMLDEPSAWHNPSWSWAATKRPVKYNLHLGDRVQKSSAKYSSFAAIQRIDVDSNNPKSFGHVFGGCLEVTGILRLAKLLEVRSHTIHMRWDRRPNCSLDKLWSLELGSWEVAGDMATMAFTYFLLLEPLYPAGHDMIGYQRVGISWCESTEVDKPNIQPPGDSMKICIV